MKYRIKIIGAALGVRTGHDGEYVVDYEPASMDAHGEYLQDGRLVTSADPEQGRTFDDIELVLSYYTQAKGRRPDGEPNRPLTCYTVEIETLEP